MTAEPGAALGLARAAARHSLGWLVAANLVGLWMSLVLLWPAAGELAGPLTYGRWVPLHLDWQLYGWSALPLVGVLLGWTVDERDERTGRHGRLALAAWSVALALGGASWLTGHVSGKLFLDWSGFARPLLPAAMLVLWGVLLEATRARWAALSGRARLARGGLLAALLPVPPLLHWSMGREVYPAVNPDSGGATGAALLGSTLGIVTIFLLLPSLLRLAPREDSGRRRAATLAALAASWAVFAAIDHGHASHHARAQSASLAVLLLWVPLLAGHWRGFAWPAAARPWLAAALVWWTLLVASGWVMFLPRLSEALKFTHALVAHAHLAMAGVVTSVNGMLLTTLARRAAPRGVFVRWQAGCAIQVAAMLALGVFELERAGELFRSEAWTQALMGARLVGGLLMVDASGRWLTSAWEA
jgi:cytochrome c oxidase cbb3-type subunit 1